MITQQTTQFKLCTKDYVKAEAPVLWLPHAKSWLIGKDSDSGRDWGQAEKGMTEDEMAGWHHWLDGHESEWTLGIGDEQEGLACCDSWGCKESDTTERLIWSDLIHAQLFLFLTMLTITWALVILEKRKGSEIPLNLCVLRRWMFHLRSGCFSGRHLRRYTVPAGAESARVQVQGHLKENWIPSFLFPLISWDKEFR